MLPLKRKLLLACIAVAAFCANGPAASVVPFVERGSDTTVGSLRGARGTVHIETTTTAQAREMPHVKVEHLISKMTHKPIALRFWVRVSRLSTSRLEQPYKQERRHTLTQNLKAMGLWVFLLIRCSTFTVLSDVRHITHTCTQHSLALH